MKLNLICFAIVAFAATNIITVSSDNSPTLTSLSPTRPPTHTPTIQLPTNSPTVSPTCTDVNEWCEANRPVDCTHDAIVQLCPCQCMTYQPTSVPTHSPSCQPDEVNCTIGGCHFDDPPSNGWGPHPCGCYCAKHAPTLAPTLSTTSRTVIYNNKTKTDDKSHKEEIETVIIVIGVISAMAIVTAIIYCIALSVRSYEPLENDESYGLQ